MRYGSSEYIKRNWPAGYERHKATTNRNALTRVCKRLQAQQGIPEAKAVNSDGTDYHTFPVEILEQGLRIIRGESK